MVHQFCRVPGWGDLGFWSGEQGTPCIFLVRSGSTATSSASSVYTKFSQLRTSHPSFLLFFPSPSKSQNGWTCLRRSGVRLFVQPSQLQLQCQNMYKIMLGNEHLQASSWKVEKDTMDWLAVASFVCTRKRLMHANSKHPQKSSVVELAMGDVFASSCCECGLYNRGNHPCTQVPTPQQFRAKSWAEHTARRFFVDRVATRHPFSGSRVLD